MFRKNFCKAALSSALAAIALLTAACSPAPTPIDALYARAVEDAMIAEEEEIFPLVSLTEEDERTAWDEQGRTLLLSWHAYPDSYPAGENVVLAWGEVWTFTLGEIADWYAEEEGVQDWTLRLEQLIGLPADDGKTHISAFWADVEDVVRPAYQPDPTQGAMEDNFAEGFAEEDADEIAFKEWFDGNIVDSYYDGAYPWTRLGYTYDWAEDSDEYGLTEFLILAGSEVEVAFTETTEAFLQRLEETAR